MAELPGVDASHDPAELLNGVRNELDITWEDEDTDRKLTGIIARGMSFLDGRVRRKLDYGAEGMPRALLLDYCRYVRSGALDDFIRNYNPEFLDLILEEVTRGAGETNHADL